MTPVDLVVTAPHFYTMAGTGLGYKKNAAMAVDRGRITALGPADEILKAYRPENLRQLASHVVLPGLIDAHMHMTDALLRGLAQDTDQWMMHGISPFQIHMDGKARRLGVQLAVAEGLAAGTTCFTEFSDFDRDILRFMAAAGVRCPFTVRIREARETIYEPGELYLFDPDKGRKSLEECLEAHDHWQGRADGRISILFGPQGPDFVSPELLKEIHALALARNARIHMHVQQGDRETFQIVERYGKRPIAYLNDLGVMDASLIAVHLTDADEDEARTVARSGASMILCSGSIGIIDGIVPPAKAFLDAGGAVALGSDQAPGNNCHNMFNEMKLTALFNKIRYRDPTVMPAWQVLKMATINGARALGMDGEIGSLEPGKQADFIAVDLNTPALSPVITRPMRNIVPNLVYSARGGEVSLTAVQGKILYENGAFTTLDVKGILNQAAACARALTPRGEADFLRINGTNARMMKDDLL